MKTVLMIVAILGLTACNTHYSDGVRAGQLYKFSKKGLFVKTWEGTLKTGFIVKDQNGIVAEEFYFSVTDEKIAQKLTGLLGKQVELHYDELIFTEIFISPDSGYRIKEVKELN